MNGTTDVEAPPYTAPIPIGDPRGSHDYLYVLGFFCTVIFLLTITYAAYIHKKARSQSLSATTVYDDGYEDSLVRFSRGVNDDVLVTFPTFVYSDTTPNEFDDTAEEGSGCCICLEEYKTADVVKLFPECGHLFHVRCIDTWLKAHPTCPVCRNLAGSS